MMELTNEQKELFHLLRDRGVEKPSAIGAVVFVEDSKKPYNLIIDWIKENQEAKRDEILDKLEEFYD